MNFSRSTYQRSASQVHRTGFSLLEMMVAVALLAVIIVGLLATQLIRFAGLFAGRSYDKPYWTLGAAIAGAVIFGWIAAADQED